MVTQLFSKREVAEKLQISERTVHNLVISGKLSSTKIGRKRMFTEYHINKLIQNGEA
jgi:excisionase family DNA binding protein